MTWFKLTAPAVSRAFHILLHITDSGLSILHALVATNLVSSAFSEKQYLWQFVAKKRCQWPCFPNLSSSIITSIFHFREKIMAHLRSISDSANSQRPDSSTAVSPLDIYQSFTPFPRLPFEIRDMIWSSLSSEPRVIEIHSGRSRVIRNQRLSTLLLICQESRKHFLKNHILRCIGVGYANRQVPICFDPAQDLIYIMSGKNRHRQPPHFPDLSVLGDIQHLGLHGYTLCRIKHFLNLIRSLKNLKSLTFLLPVHSISSSLLPPYENPLCFIQTYSKWFDRQLADFQLGNKDWNMPELRLVQYDISDDFSDLVTFPYETCVAKRINQTSFFLVEKNPKTESSGDVSVERGST
jgi:hypothetical protein